MKDKLDFFISFFLKAKEKCFYDFSFVCLSILICIIPLPNVINNIVVGIFVFYTIL